ncbi:MAG: hypothetical protein WCJ54_09375 [Actinomycetota bacterium]
MLKRMTEVHNLSNLRTVNNLKKGTGPLTGSGACLGMYILYKQKEILEKESYVLEKRKSGNQTKIDAINEKLKELEKNVKQKDGTEVTKRKLDNKNTKTIFLKY